MKHVFISYSWQDQPLARRVARRLRHAGLDVFLDQDRSGELGPGRSLPSALAEAIGDASHILLVWTPAAAEAAAPGRWVGHELDLARAAIARGTRLVPLLFHDPRAHPLVNETIGVSFHEPHRFEDDWAKLLQTVFPDARDEPDERCLQVDLVNTLEETPRIYGVFCNPVDKAVAGMPGGAALQDGNIDPGAREAALARAREAFAAWTPDSISVAGLPRPADADWHALDFALWCGAREVVERARLPGLKPVELARYPGVFGRVLAATGAGFGALRVLFGAYPGLAFNALIETKDASTLADEALPVALDLFEDRFRADVIRDWLPFGTAALFAERQHARLSAAQRRRLFDMIEVTGNLPQPGTPTDLLFALMRDPELRPAAVEKLVAWVNGGLFDRADVDRGHDSPMIAHGLVRAMSAAGYVPEAEALLDAILTRVRRLLRSGTDTQRMDAIRWIHQGDRLPQALRWRLRAAVEEGVYSSQFETAPYGSALAPLVMQLARSLESDERIDDDVMRQIRACLQAHGLPNDIW